MNTTNEFIQGYTAGEQQRIILSDEDKSADALYFVFYASGAHSFSIEQSQGI